MKNDSYRRSTLMFKALALLIVGIVGGIVTVFLVVGSILLFIKVFDPVGGGGGGGDPMGGLTATLYLLGGNFSIGAVISIIAFIVIRRRRMRHM